MTTETICLDSLEEVASDEVCPLDVWVRLPPDDNGSRYIRRKRYRTFREIYNSMHEHLDRIECESCGETIARPKRRASGEYPKCKCGGGAGWLEWLDEYDSNGDGWRNEDSVIAQRGEEILQIMCFANVGGNEGYQAHLSVELSGDGDQRRTVHLYWIKSFRGMQHVYKLVGEMMKATGVWPEWCQK